MQKCVLRVTSKATWITLGFSVMALVMSCPVFCDEVSLDTPITASSVEADRKAYRATHLPWAVVDNPEQVAELIKDGQDVNAIDEDGRTALHFAVLHDHYGTTKLLLDNGANVNVKEHSRDGGFSGWGWYPLHLALRNENKDIIRLLIDHGADVNAVRTDGWTPICTAAYHGQPDMIELLISKGADVNYDNSEPLRIAISQGKYEAAKVMVNHKAVINSQKKDGQTALHLAAGRGDLLEVKLLIDNKAKVNIADNEGRTPLFLAAYSGVVDVVKLLISKGAKADVRTKAGVSILQAASNGKRDHLASHPQSDDLGKYDWYGVRRILLRHGAKE
ncbi:MAG: ankyrin repeat domain-containing protein [Armatimonadota bacterium]|nr:ankyrin repeat domain-containing protein [bacterium]